MSLVSGLCGFICSHLWKWTTWTFLRLNFEEGWRSLPRFWGNKKNILSNISVKLSKNVHFQQFSRFHLMTFIISASLAFLIPTPNLLLSPPPQHSWDPPQSLHPLTNILLAGHPVGHLDSEIPAKHHVHGSRLLVPITSFISTHDPLLIFFQFEFYVLKTA